MAFEVNVTRQFSASHQLRLYNGAPEPLHVHNWVVSIRVGSAELDAIGVVIDFHELERLIDEIIGPMHNLRLNDLPAFSSINPSAENVALHIGKNLKLPSPLKLLWVEAWETPGNSAVYRP